MQAVRKARFAAADHRAQAGAAGADHDDVVDVVFDRIGAAVDCGTGAAVFAAVCAILCHAYNPNDSLRMP